MPFAMGLHHKWFRYPAAVLVVIIATVVRMVFLDDLGVRIPYVTFYPAVMIATLFGGFPAGLMATALSAFLASYYLLEPVHQVLIKDYADWLGMAVFIVSCTIISGTSAVMRRAQLRAREAESQAILASEREKAERALNNERAMLKTLVQAIPDLVWLKDPNGVYLFCNKVFERLFGTPEEGIIGKTDHDFVDTELADFFREKDRAAIAAGGPKVNEEWVTYADDGHRALLETIKTPVYDADGRLTGVLGIARDITARNQAEESIRILSQAVNQSPVSIVLTDIDGTITFVNPKFTQLTGYEMAEAVGQNPRILKSEITPTEVYEELWATISSGNVWHGEFQNKKKNGDLFWEHATIAPIINNNGEISHYMAIKEDITERKLLMEKLLQSQKMEAIGKLAGGIAHDFNNIITAIIGYGTLLEMKMDKDDPQLMHIGQILAAANRAADLTRSLLAFSRKQIINPQPVDLNQIIKNTQKFLQRIIGEDIDLKTNFHNKVLQVNADSGQIEQVLMNLATNSRDAMPAGGIFSIETESVEIDDEFINAHGYGEKGAYAMISITDSGCGMDETTLKSLFEPFFTTKEVGKGTGLGLSIVYGIIKQHNGFINVYSELGFGTAFTIYLPLTATEVHENPETKVELPQRGTETILVADDDAMLRGLARKLLSQFGYAVITAEDGEDAVKKFNENKEKISLVILDIIMPKMNGKEAREAIWNIRPDIKVIFFSGYTADIIHARGMLDTDLDFIAKPLNPVKLLAKVRELLDRAN